jgi:hypothetical protein
VRKLTGMHFQTHKKGIEVYSQKQPSRSQQAMPVSPGGLRQALRHGPAILDRQAASGGSCGPASLRSAVPLRDFEQFSVLEDVIPGLECLQVNLGTANQMFRSGLGLQCIA